VIDDSLHFRVRHPLEELVQIETLCSLNPLSEFLSRLLLYVLNLGDGGRVHSVFFNGSEIFAFACPKGVPSMVIGAVRTLVGKLTWSRSTKLEA